MEKKFILIYILIVTLFISSCFSGNPTNVNNESSTPASSPEATPVSVPTESPIATPESSRTDELSNTTDYREPDSTPRYEFWILGYEYVRQGYYYRDFVGLVAGPSIVYLEDYSTPLLDPPVKVETINNQMYFYAESLGDAKLRGRTVIDGEDLDAYGDVRVLERILDGGDTADKQPVTGENLELLIELYDQVYNAQNLEEAIKILGSEYITDKGYRFPEYLWKIPSGGSIWLTADSSEIIVVGFALV